MAPRARRGEETEAEEGAIALILPTEKVLKDLARLRKSTSTRAGAITDEYAKAVQNAVEKKHVDRKALSILTSLSMMDPIKLAVTLPQLMHGIEALGLDDIASRQGDMFTAPAGDGENEEETGETDGKKKKKATRKPRAAKEAGGNVTALGTVARQVAEEAGETAH